MHQWKIRLSRYCSDHLAKKSSSSCLNSNTAYCELLFHKSEYKQVSFPELFMFTGWITARLSRIPTNIKHSR